MVDSEKRDFMEVMTGLSEYYGREVSVPVIKIYWEGLRVYDLQAIREAAGRHIADPDAGKWMPKIADIVKMLSGTTGDAALIAWAKVDKAVRAVGTYSDVVFDDPIIHRVLQDMGGWVMLGTKTDHDWQFVAKEFETRYRGYKIRGVVDSHPPVLTGIANTSNMTAGQTIELPVMVGLPADCKRVMDAGSLQPAIGLTRVSPQTLRIGGV